MFRTAFASIRQRALLSRGYASSARSVRVSKLGLAPKVAVGASLMALAIMYPQNQALNDVKELAKELAQEASKKTESVKEDIKAAVAPDEKKPDGGSEEPEEGQAAFNPETGEINWDCPCLGGMAHGPCGEEFKEAFACFVYSETEPKGIDCIKKFEAMRTCFKQHPEHYKEELYEDEEVPSVEKDAPVENAPAEDVPVAASAAVAVTPEGVTEVTEIDVIPADELAQAKSEVPSSEGLTESEVALLKEAATNTESAQEQPKL